MRGAQSELIDGTSAQARRREGLLLAGLGAVGLERLILYLNPTLVLGFSAFPFGKIVTRGQIIALALSYAGVVCVLGRELSLSGADVPLGAVLIFCGAVSYALYLTLSGQEVRRLGALRLTGLATSVASIMCIGQFLVLRPLTALAVDPAVVWLTAWAVLGTALVLLGIWLLTRPALPAGRIA